MAVNARFLPDRRFFDVVGVLLTRALKTRYRGSVLGVFWSAVSPLGMSAVYAAIFGHTFAGYYGGSLATYAASVYIGLTLIGFFVGGTTAALPSIIANAGLLNKLRIPYEAFPLSILGAYGFQQVIGSLPLIAIASLVFNHNPLHLVVLLVPLLSLAMLSVGAGFFVSALCVYFRDVPNLYELATFLLWVMSPVFYPAQIVPHSVLRIIEWNPLFAIIESSRTLVLTSSYPSAAVLTVNLAISLIVFVGGLAAFRLMRAQFMDLL